MHNPLAAVCEPIPHEKNELQGTDKSANKNDACGIHFGALCKAETHFVILITSYKSSASFNLP